MLFSKPIVNAILGESWEPEALFMPKNLVKIIDFNAIKYGLTKEEFIVDVLRVDCSTYQRWKNAKASPTMNTITHMCEQLRRYTAKSGSN